METSSTIRLDQLQQQARQRIDATEADILLSHVLGKPRTWLFMYPEAIIQAESAQRFLALIDRRLQGEPVAYLTGSRGFWRFDLDVTPDTLIPRPETELLVEWALERIPPGRRLHLLDLGTGSGAIALALAVERPDARVLATDCSEGALEVAQRNARRLSADNLAFRRGSWCAALHADERFDVVVSNPPYIAGEDRHLSEGDLRYEPATALTPGGDGLEAIRVILRGVPRHLHAGGWVLLEHGHDQGAAVRELLSAAGFDEVRTRQDLEARDRVSLGRWTRTG